jgi:hypothetical protein
MDISFHYFAVKSLAKKAGFAEADAQKLATFSQYIDDFNAWAYRRYGNVPDWIKASDRYDLYLPNPLDPFNFNPATTGFMSGSWMSSHVDYVWLATSNAQKFTVSPFHFIPQNAHNRRAGDLRAAPARLGDGQYISEALVSAADAYRDEPDPDMKAMRLMKLGMLLHTFADTWAHQLFSGFNSPLNAASLISVTNNITGLDQTAKYRDWVARFFNWLTAHGLPSFQIGHMNVGHVPDLTHLRFVMNYPLRDGGTGIYGRSNTEVFLQASREILNCLRRCMRQGDIPEPDWAPISAQLSQCFLVDISDLEGERAIVNFLTPVWNRVFGYNYAYDHTLIFDGIIGEFPAEVAGVDEDERGADAGAGGAAVEDVFPNMGDDFYYYNCYAEDLLILLYGNKPRS